MAIVSDTEQNKTKKSCDKNHYFYIARHHFHFAAEKLRCNRTKCDFKTPWLYCGAALGQDCTWCSWQALRECWPLLRLWEVEHWKKQILTVANALHFYLPNHTLSLDNFIIHCNYLPVKMVVFIHKSNLSLIFLLHSVTGVERCIELQLVWSKRGAEWHECFWISLHRCIRICNKAKSKLYYYGQAPGCRG